MLVSIIIPMYNREKTIKMAVESILEQTCQDFELIIVDDCSTDRSVEIVKNIDDDRIRLIISEKNGGACAARNIGIENAQGEFIAFQDSDDFWHADKLEKSLYYLKREDADMVFSALMREEEKKGKIIRSRLPVYNLNQESDKLGRVMWQNCVSTQTIVAKKSLFQDVCFDPVFPRFQDWDFIIQVLLKQKKVYFIDEALVDCYVVENSITSDGRKAVKALGLMEKKYMHEFGKRPDIYGKFCAKAGYLIEMSGGNGSYYFKKEYSLKKSPGKIVKVILTSMRLYRPINSCFGSLIEKIYKKRR